MLQYLTVNVKYCNIRESFMLKRHILEELEAYLQLMPVVLLIGARQTGKTTLVETLVQKRDFSYFTLDDELSLSNALADPSGWIESLPKPVIIDEIQRAPELFLSIKKDVDQNRIPGRYLLTGSANPLLLPKLGDSLAGRMGILHLLPFSQGELRGIRESFIETIFGELFTSKIFEPLSFETLLKIFLKGGFPPVRSLQDLKDVKRWFRSYLQTMMERDVRDIANIEGLREFPRLFRLLATRSGMLLNISDLSRSMGMINMTLNRYLRILESLFFIYLLPAWFSNLGKRIIKSPKLHICDTALLAQLIEVDENRLKNDPSLAGQFLENFIFAELLKQKSWSSVPFEIYHFRDGDYEVDFVLEKPEGTIIGVEVKSSKSVSNEDLRGLIHLKKIAKNRFKRGIILHPGNKIESLGEGLWACPIQALWQ